MSEKRFDLDDGPFGKRLTVESKWDSVVRDAIHANHVEDLVIWNPWHFPSRDLNFLCEFSSLRALRLVETMVDLRPLECLKRLRHLDVITLDKNPIDFSSFPEMESLVVGWSQAVKGLVKLRTLTKLFINHPPKWVIREIGKMTELEDLALLSCPAEDLNPLGALSRLRRLRITLFRKNTDNAFVANLVNLEDYFIQDSTGFTSLEPLRNLTNLKSICLEDCGVIDSLQPLVAHNNLRSFVIAGAHTGVADGDYSPVEDMPQLQRYFR